MSASPATLHPSRVAGRCIAAGAAGSAQQSRVARGDGAATDSAIARRWGLSHTAVARLFDPSSGVSIALGDVLALPRELGRDILVRCLGALEEGEGPAPRATLSQLTIELGRAVEDLERDLADGHLDEHERHRAHLCRIGSLALRGLLSLGGGAR